MSQKTPTALLAVIVQSFMEAVFAQVLACKAEHLDVEMFSCQVLD